ncbi:metal-dependent transcriptional regulator [Hyunsoonleella pacifica]|uniref:Transcriptional regulator MntR n=1 Tax=Hyunsoonleella pacifica TaxID=1080224 RepID=A0A4Q9FQN5_9FLAO|nr:metal-dependent transcriptional regulator [Hyunsoonleella pacifica]TBN16551.1 metal-dependent transcriptional regulator [Hyunsoonleella pacifica]GGD18505.1 iron-dependent repressor [Hyunsoonleella pacifica]
MITLTEENYIKAIYHLGKQGATNVSTNAIAKEMETKASSVTDMVKKLSEKGYVDYKKYQGVSLTEEGEIIAINIVRKHRLWEVFLVEKLNFSWDEIHDVAEQLEHIKSKKLITQLDAFLGYPTHDPHGDPIPDATGKIKKIDKILLSEAKVGDTCICVGVIDSSTEFLQYLDKHKISLGCAIKLLQREPFDNSITIEIEGKELAISNMIANNLFVKVA